MGSLSALHLRGRTVQVCDCYQSSKSLLCERTKGATIGRMKAFFVLGTLLVMAFGHGVSGKEYEEQTYQGMVQRVFTRMGCLCEKDGKGERSIAMLRDQFLLEDKTTSIDIPCRISK